MRTQIRFLGLSVALVALIAGLIPAFAGKPGGKPPTLALSVTVSPSAITEGTTATGTVSHNNSSLASPVTVTLNSSDTSEATVPASVTIPAGANSTTFTVTAVDDGTADGDQPATVSATAGGYTSSNTTITVSDKPVFEYRTEEVPTGINNGVQINGITNNSRVYGWMAQIVDGTTLYKSGYVYDQVSQTMYDLNQIPSLTAQVHLLAGPDFGLTSIAGMNESGLMTGYVEDSSWTRLGIAIDTTVDGQFSPDPADWVIQLLPDFDSSYTYGRRINESGDIVGIFERADGTKGEYLYNPWLGGAPAILPDLRGGGTVELNDLAQVAGIDEFGRAFLYNAVTESIQFFADADYQTVTGLNNSGVFAGNALITVPATKGNRTTTTRIAFRHDGTLRPIAGSTATASAISLNDAGDVGYSAVSSWDAMLSHAGFAPEYTEQPFSLSKVIAADDPLKAEFADREPGVFAINDRDATGYPQVVVRLHFPNSSGGNDNVAVILTPYLVP